MKNKVLTSILLLLAIIPVFVLPVFGMNYKIYGIFSIILIVLTISAVRINKEIFATILFFALIHIFRPLNDWFTDLTIYFILCIKIITAHFTSVAITQAIYWNNLKHVFITLIVIMFFCYQILYGLF